MKIFVVAGNNAEFLDYRKRKFEDLKQTTTPINFGDIINVSSPSVIRGFHDPHGVFIGTWRQRKDIGEVITNLQICQMNSFSNKVLTELKEEWEKFQTTRPTPKIKTKPLSFDVDKWDGNVHKAAAAFAKAIDDEVLKQVINSPIVNPNEESIQSLLASKTVYEHKDPTKMKNWIYEYLDSLE